jgi:hypothetical protein
MFGYARNSGIPFLRGYIEASEYYNKVKPIKSKGRNNGLVPLGRRGSTYYSMEKWSNNSIACCYSGQPVVIFNPDNTVMIRDSKYSTISAGYFIADILPRTNAYQKDYKLVVNSNGKEYAIERGEGMLFKFVNADGTIEPVNATRSVVHHIIRSEANKVRKQYAEFRSYLLGATKVRDGMFSDDEFKAVFGVEKRSSEDNMHHWEYINMPDCTPDPKSTEQLFSLIDSGNPEDANKAVLTLALGSGTRHYRFNSYKTSAEQISRKLDEFLFAKNKDTVFKVIGLPEGKILKDRWGYMFGK